MSLTDYSAKKPRPFATSPEVLCDLGKRIVQFEGRALFYFCYLTACRITEALRLKRGDLEDYEEKQGVVVAFLSNLKNRKRSVKPLPIPLNANIAKTAAEVYMARFFWDFAKKIPEKDKEVFAHYSRFEAFHLFSQLELPKVDAIFQRKRITITNFSVNPHYLRHCRLTHLVSMYHLDHILLQQWAGWTKTDIANQYIMLDWAPLAVPFFNLNIGKTADSAPTAPQKIPRIENVVCSSDNSRTSSQ